MDLDKFYEDDGEEGEEEEGDEGEEEEEGICVVRHLAGMCGHATPAARVRVVIVIHGCACA